MKKLSISTKSLLWVIFAAVVLALTSSCSIDQCTEVMCIESYLPDFSTEYGEMEFECGKFNIGDYYRLNDTRYRVVPCY